ncbi:MAG: 6-phosphofructokinase [Oscillospiraceae bacterium]|nr:6-phosphofructokinase [Oscillospiraceae bacterium]
MKGNVMVGQSGGPTAVINASLAGVFDAAVNLHGASSKVYGMLHGVQGLLKGNYVDLGEFIGSEADLELLKRTPAAFLGSCRYKLRRAADDDGPYRQLFKMLDELGIDYFFYIGGNDSMDTIDQLSAYAAKINSPIRFIGVPKTIDNDLVLTDHTPGFGSAAKYIATATKELIRDGKVNDMDGVTVVEIMGRDAGWLTGSAALCRGDDCPGPDLIYLPEVPFDIDSFLQCIYEKQKQNRMVVAAVSEGIRFLDGKYVCEASSSLRNVDAFGHKQLTGSARVLADIIAGDVGCKVRAIEFSSLQRCAAHLTSLTDVNEAFMVGQAAVKAASEGYSGKFIMLKRVSDDPYVCQTDICDVSLVANLKKEVPREWINDDGNNVTSEFINYVTPLIQGEFEPIMENGLPKHIPYVVKPL